MLLVDGQGYQVQCPMNTLNSSQEPNVESFYIELVCSVQKLAEPCK